MEASIGIKGFFQSFWSVDIVKLQVKVQTSVLGQGVDFVLPLSQQEEQAEEEEPHQNYKALSEDEPAGDPLGLVKKQKVIISFFAGVNIIVKYIKNIYLNFQKNRS